MVLQTCSAAGDARDRCDAGWHTLHLRRECICARNEAPERSRAVACTLRSGARRLLQFFALPRILEAAIGLPFAAKLAISALLLAPLGFAMGMPFPSGLRAISAAASTAKHGAVEWAWAMNAASSVLGSVLAIVIAIQFGLNVTLACGAVAYVVAMLLLPTFGKTVVRG